MKNYLSIILLLLIIRCASPLEPATQIVLERSSEFEQYDAAKIEVANFLETYLNQAFDSNYQFLNNQWDSEILTFRQDWFLVENTSKETMIASPPKILGIREIEDKSFALKLAINKNDELLRILHLKIKKDPLDRFYFKDVLSENLRSFHATSNHGNQFYYQPTITADSSLEDSTHLFNQRMADFFDLPLKPLTTIVLQDYQSLNQLLGYDYSINLLTDIQQGGFALPKEELVFSINGKPYYPHEIVHIYSDVDYGKCHHWFDEGLAAYFGGSIGYPLDFHLKKLADNLDQQDFSFIPRDRNFDKTTNYKYAIGGLLVKIALEEKAGKADVFRLMAYPNTKKGFFEAIEAVFGIKEEGFEGFILQELSKYSNE